MHQKRIKISIENIFIPSHSPASAVPQDSHFPDSSGRPRNGFDSWLAWLIGQSLFEDVDYITENQNNVCEIYTFN